MLPFIDNIPIEPDIINESYTRYGERDKHRDLGEMTISDLKVELKRVEKISSDIVDEMKDVIYSPKYQLKEALQTNINYMEKIIKEIEKKEEEEKEAALKKKMEEEASKS